MTNEEKYYNVGIIVERIMTAKVKAKNKNEAEERAHYWRNLEEEETEEENIIKITDIWTEEEENDC